MLDPQYPLAYASERKLLRRTHGCSGLSGKVGLVEPTTYYRSGVQLWKFFRLRTQIPLGVLCASLALSGPTPSVAQSVPSAITSHQVASIDSPLETKPAVQPGSSVRLITASVPAGSAAAGTIEIDIQGKDLTKSLTVSLTGSEGDIVHNTALLVDDARHGHISASIAAPLDPDKSYTVHLYDASGAQLGFAGLNLENVVVYQSIAARSSQFTLSATGMSKADAKAALRKAKDIERQTAVNQRLAAAQTQASAVQRQLYLVNHPDVTPSFESGQSVPTYPNVDQPGANPSCEADNATEKQYIRVRRSLVDPKEGSDSYGRRLGRRFLIFEITVQNTSPSLQYMIHNVSVDLSRLHGLKPGTDLWFFSSQDLIMLRGVPEKGSDYDPRNLTYHLMRGTGAVAGGITGLTAEGIQDIYGGAVAAFNGPLLSSFIDIFPDHTATQLNRLSDSAFTANTVVSKQAAKTFAIFVPEGVFLKKSEQNAYWKEPISVLSNPSLDFRQADVCVDGTFISEVAALTLSQITFDDPALANPGSSVAVTVAGTNLVAADTELNAFGQTVQLDNINTDGNIGKATISIPSTWDFRRSTQATLESKKTGLVTPALSLTLPQTPILAIVTFADKTKAAKGATVTLNIAGKRLVAGDTQLSGFSQIVNVTGISTDGTTGVADITLPQDYDPTKGFPFTLISKNTGNSSDPVTLPATGDQ